MCKSAKQAHGLKEISPAPSLSPECINEGFWKRAQVHPGNCSSVMHPFLKQRLPLMLCWFSHFYFFSFFFDKILPFSQATLFIFFSLNRSYVLGEGLFFVFFFFLLVVHVSFFLFLLFSFCLFFSMTDRGHFW